MRWWSCLFGVVGLLTASYGPPALAQAEPQYRPLETFRDCSGCPEMVVIPAGSFMMGSPASETGRYEDEGPVHRVTVQQFALARAEVTFDQWQACVDDGGCRSNRRPGDDGWGRGSRPVINVSWEDAQEYVAWLNGKVSGTPYRLPSEAEWEYAARAGTSTAYPWGDRATHEYANYGKDDCCGGLAKGADRWEYMAPVGSFPANPLGLRDMHGNIWEWVEDCWHGNYNGAPRTASAWLSQQNGNCSLRVLRGGSWFHNPGFLRSAFRDRIVPGNRGGILGFRPARTLFTP